MQATQPPAMTDAERDAHIQSCSDAFLAAYARFEDYGLPADRDEAYQWMHMRNAALLEKVLDEGVDYFQFMGTQPVPNQQEAVHGR